MRNTVYSIILIYPGNIEIINSSLNLNIIKKSLEEFLNSTMKDFNWSKAENGDEAWFCSETETRCSIYRSNLL